MQLDSGKPVPDCRLQAAGIMSHGAVSLISLVVTCLQTSQNTLEQRPQRKKAAFSSGAAAAVGRGGLRLPTWFNLLCPRSGAYAKGLERPVTLPCPGHQDMQGCRTPEPATASGTVVRTCKQAPFVRKRRRKRVRFFDQIKPAHGSLSSTCISRGATPGAGRAVANYSWHQRCQLLARKYFIQ